MFKIDRSSWSNSSRASSIYGKYFQVEECYEDCKSTCKKCKCSFIFTAEEQKYYYEVQKKLIRYIPSLCKECSKLYDELNVNLSKYMAEWKSNKSILCKDRVFLSEWMLLLKEKESYGKRTDQCNIRALVKRLHNIPI